MINRTLEEKEEAKLVVLHAILKQNSLSEILVKVLNLGLNDHFRHMWE